MSKEADQSQQQSRGILKLSGMDAIRLRSGMYVDAYPEAIYNMLNAILDNTIDESMAGNCTCIEITLHQDNSVTISDNSRGLPVEVSPYIEKSQLEVRLTMIFMGSGPRTGYYAEGGMHGINLLAINALSGWLIAEVKRDGYLWRQQYKGGDPITDVEKVRPLATDEATGTSITYLPDAEVFPGLRDGFTYNIERLEARCRQLAYILHGTTLRLIDERSSDKPYQATFYPEDGLASYVRDLNRDRIVIHPIVTGAQIAPYNKNMNIEVEFAFQYTDDLHTDEVLFVNTVETPHGGTHRAGLRAALTRTINQWMKAHPSENIARANFTGEETLKGLTAIVSVKHPCPRFISQTKIRLENPEVKSIVETAVTMAFQAQLQSNPEQAMEFLSRQQHLLGK